MSVPVVVPADGPMFEGHFPGRPILPGVAALTLIADALAPGGGAADVATIPFLRFRGLVLPSDRLDVDAVSRGEGGVRFEARRSGELVANGALTFGGRPSDAQPGSAVAARASRTARPLQELIPHRPPMLFVERVLGEAEDGATCLSRVPAACALVTRGAAPGLIALEAAAQTAAVWEALRRLREDGTPSARLGYLVSLRDVVLFHGTIPAGADVIATIRLVATAPPLTTYDVDVSVEGDRALRGTIGTYLSESE